MYGLVWIFLHLECQEYFFMWILLISSILELQKLNILYHFVFKDLRTPFYTSLPSIVCIVSYDSVQSAVHM